jgi:hypothetical protein
MKKIVLIPLLLAMTMQLNAQQQTKFKLAYMPKSSYNTTREMKMVMTMVGDAAAGQVLDMTMSTTAIIATGAADKDNTYPVIITTKTNKANMTMNGQEMLAGSIPNTTVVVYGKYLKGDKLMIDSLAGQKMNDSIRMALAKMMDAVVNTVKFPDHPLKVGDTFTQEAPFAVPMMGNAAGMTVKMTYKLISVAYNLAVFDFNETMTMNMDQTAQNLKMTMTGLGTGTLSYNIGKQYVATMVNTLNMDYDMAINDMSMKGKSTISMNDKTKLVAN